MEIPIAVPLYRCADCGFVTTASQENAVRAHALGSPQCSGQLVVIADFAPPPTDVTRRARRRRATSRGSGSQGGVGRDPARSDS